MPFELIAELAGVTSLVGLFVAVIVAAAGAWERVPTPGVAANVVVSWSAAVLFGAGLPWIIPAIETVVGGTTPWPRWGDSMVASGSAMAAVGGAVVGAAVVPVTAALGVVSNRLRAPLPVGVVVVAITGTAAAAGPTLIGTWGSIPVAEVLSVATGCALALSAALPWRGGYLLRGRRAARSRGLLPPMRGTTGARSGGYPGVT